MRVKAVLFDFGGTLDGPGRPWLDRFTLAYRSNGLDVSHDRLAQAFGHSTRAAYADREMSGRRLHQTVAFHVDRQLRFLGIEGHAAADGIIAAFVADTEAALTASRNLLAQLRPRAQVGVISNFYGNVRLLLDDAGISPLLDTIVDSTCVGVAKPDPQVFRIALAELGREAAEALYVGDSFEKDMAAAHRAGLRTAWLLGARDRRPPQPGIVDAVIHRLEDVEALLENGVR